MPQWQFKHSNVFIVKGKQTEGKSELTEGELCEVMQLCSSGLTGAQLGV